MRLSTANAWRLEVRAFMKMRGITHEDLGKLMGIKQPAVTKLLTIGSTDLQLGTIERVHAALGAAQPTIHLEVDWRKHGV